MILLANCQYYKKPTYRGWFSLGILITRINAGSHPYGVILALDSSFIITGGLYEKGSMLFWNVFNDFGCIFEFMYESTSTANSG